MKRKKAKKLNISFWESLKKVQGLSWPKLESILLVFFLSFCAFFGFTVFLLGEKIRADEGAVIQSEQIVIDPEIKEMLAGSPMERMVPYLSQKDKQVASYLVAIAKKESNWGKYAPKKMGRECYNYWGYRGPEDKTLSGYSCFKSPRQAVNIVGDRIASLLAQKIDTPSEMVVWKCGRNCEAAGGQAAADKWVRDVDHYYRQLYN